MPFACSICGEGSTRICARCTKDACDNHLCEKCLKCSDCCECEVRLSEPVTVARVVVAAEALPHVDEIAAAVEIAVEPEAEHAPAGEPEAEPLAEAAIEPAIEPAAEPLIENLPPDA